MQKTSKRVLAVVLALAMMLSVFSISAAAYNANYESETHTVFKHTEQTLAPGVEYYNNYAYSSDGKQMVYYVATADINRDDVLVQGSYLNASIDTMGMSKLTEQVAAANAKFSDPTNEEFISENYTVVAGTNGDFYNMQTGKPSGAFAINGKIMNNANNRPWFAIFEDGTATCGANNADYEAAIAEHGAVQNSVGGSQLLVKDGEDVTATASGSYNTDRHSRTMIGVTADNKVVCAVLDGRQEPFSCGGTMHELAQIMIEADCVIAINLDGGGSTTFGARPEGEDEFKVLNRPSDGSPRSISSGVVIASLAAPSNVFDRVSIVPDDEYVTPGTATDLTFTGVSASGSSADIPAEVTYSATLGDVVDGQFVSDGTAGDAVITAEYNGNAVGTATVHVVVPDSIAFSQESYTIPYSKSSDIAIIAKYGFNEVAHKAADFTITLGNPDAGTLDGFVLTAADESDITDTTISAALNGTELTTEATLLFGKGSEVIFDFEDGTTNGFNLSYSNYNYYLPKPKVFVATKENGQVHSGDYALGLNIDYSNSQESGYQMISLYQGKVSGGVQEYDGAISMGAWLYIPDEYVGLWVRWMVFPITGYDEDGSPKVATSTITSNAMDRGAGGTGVVYSFDEPGWHYLHTDLSSYKGFVWKEYYYNMQFYISDRDGAAYGYYAKDAHNINGNFTVYLDDVTVDYSTVVEDRDAPVFQSVLLGDDGPYANEALVLTDGYNSVGYNKFDFSARVADYAATNATGINGDACKAYVDGNDVGCTYANGIISAGEEVTLNEGKHTVKFVAYDNQGNRASATRTFTVSNVSRKEFIKVVPHDASLDRVLHGSLYWVDVVSTEPNNTSKVITTLNLDSMSTWELEHMEVADGFTASYEIVDAGDKVVKLTIEATEDITETEEMALVSIPIRTWEMDNKTKYNATDASKKWNYAEFKATNEFWGVAVEVRVQQGYALYKGSHRYFTGEDVFCWTESWAIYKFMTSTQEGKDYVASWNGGHDHRPAYANYYADGTTNHTTDDQIVYVEGYEYKAPTCTEDGFSGRTYCTVCNSVVDWGHVIPATGHTYAPAKQKAYYIINGGQNSWQTVDLEYTGSIGVWANGDADGKKTVATYEITEEDTVLFTKFDDNDPYIYVWYEDGSEVAAWPGVKMEYYKQNELDQALFMYKMPEAPDQDPEIMVCEDCGILCNDVVDGKLYVDGVLAQGFIEKKYYVDGVAQDYDGIVCIDDVYYEFDNGTLIGKYTGLVEEDGKTYYAQLGILTSGWKQIEGEWYYFDPETLAGVSGTYSYQGIAYQFEDNGKIVTGRWIKHAQGYAYFYGPTCYKKGWYEIDGETYAFDPSGYAYTGIAVVGYSNNVPRAYEFTDKGVLIGELNVTGVVKATNGTFYCVDGIAERAGVVQDEEGNLYYINSTYKAVTNCSYGIAPAKTNSLIPAGTYEFDENGVIINVPQPEEPTEAPTEIVEPTDAPEVKQGLSFDEDGEIRFYDNGTAIYAGVVTDGENFYYINSSCKAVKDCTYSIGAARTNGLIPAGNYVFDANGVITNLPVPEEPTDAPEPKEGLSFDEDGEIRFYVNNEPIYAGVVTDGENFYYINSSKKAVKNCTYGIGANRTNELIPAGTYQIDADGKIILPDPEEEQKEGLCFDDDGEIRYYVDGQPTYAGVVTDGEGNYYYINSSCKAVKNCTYSIGAARTNGLISAGKYDIDAEGKIIL